MCSIVIVIVLVRAERDIYRTTGHSFIAHPINMIYYLKQSPQIQLILFYAKILI